MRVISLIMRSLHLNLILFLGNIADSCVRKWWRNMQNWMGFPIPWHGPWCPEVPSIYGHSRLSIKNPQSVHVKKTLHFMNNRYRPGSENLKKKSPSLLYMFLSYFLHQSWACGFKLWISLRSKSLQAEFSIELFLNNFPERLFSKLLLILIFMSERKKNPSHLKSQSD